MEMHYRPPRRTELHVARLVHTTSGVLSTQCVGNISTIRFYNLLSLSLRIAERGVVPNTQPNRTLVREMRSYRSRPWAEVRTFKDHMLSDYNVREARKQPEGQSEGQHVPER
jgi:hypothetical protein